MKESLLASLATSEQIARAAEGPDERWLVLRRDGNGRAEVQTWPSGEAIADVAGEELAIHIVRWSPEQILVCSAALRELVDEIDDPRLLDLLARVVRVYRD